MQTCKATDLAIHQVKGGFPKLKFLKAPDIWMVGYLEWMEAGNQTKNAQAFDIKAFAHRCDLDNNTNSYLLVLNMYSWIPKFPHRPMHTEQKEKQMAVGWIHMSVYLSVCPSLCLSACLFNAKYKQVWKYVEWIHNHTEVYHQRDIDTASVTGSCLLCYILDLSDVLCISED